MTINDATLNAMAHDEQLCRQLFARSPVLQQLLTQFASDTIRNQLEALAQFDPRGIELDVPEAQLHALFDIVSRQWHLVGEQKPHWSVLAHADWLPEALNDDKLKAFYDTGRGERDLLVALAERNGISSAGLRRCVEFGCGVGRVTVHLGETFAEVEGLDISPGNLAECHKAIAARGLTTVRTTRLETPNDLEKVAPFDALFTRMVLQHNPPPIQKYLLRQLLARLNPGGIAVFQVVCAGTGYRYSVQHHLAHHDTQSFEMHALPARAVFDVIAETGTRALEVFRDTSGGIGVGSYTFVVTR